MAVERARRRLAAIMAAEVVGFSRLMEANEEATLDALRQHRHELVEPAVARLLPRGPLGRKQFSNLRVYKGSEHPHAAQSPEALDVAALNRKNARV